MKFDAARYIADMQVLIESNRLLEGRTEAPLRAKSDRGSTSAHRAHY